MRVEALSEILEEIGVSLSKEQIEQVAKDFGNHIDMEREVASYSVAFSGRDQPCRECESLKSKLKDAEKENEVFRNSVKQRRHADRVWIQGDSVMYE